MRRFTSLLLLSALATVLAACGGDDEGASADTAPAPTEAPADPGTDDPTTTTEAEEEGVDESIFEGSTLTEAPDGDFPEPSLPPEPAATAGFEEKLVYDLTEQTVELAGLPVDAASGTCDPAIDEAEPAGTYTCTIDYLEGTTSTWEVEVSGGSTFITYNAQATGDHPMSREKAEWEAAVYAGGEQAICDMDDVGSFPVGEDDVFTCQALDDDGELVDLKAQVLPGLVGRLSFTRA